MLHSLTFAFSEEESNIKVLQSTDSLKEEIGNLWSSFSSFEKWIVGIEESLLSIRKIQSKCGKEISCLKDEIDQIKDAQSTVLCPCKYFKR